MANSRLCYSFLLSFEDANDPRIMTVKPAVEHPNYPPVIVILSDEERAHLMNAFEVSPEHPQYPRALGYFY